VDTRIYRSIPWKNPRQESTIKNVEEITQEGLQDCVLLYKFLLFLTDWCQLQNFLLRKARIILKC